MDDGIRELLPTGRVAQAIDLASRGNAEVPHASRIFIITFFLYRHHRHVIAIVSEFPDSAISKTVPASRDGPNIRRKTIFGAL
jgi:hypothetical protein